MITKIRTVLKEIIFKGKIYIPRRWISTAAYVVLPLVLLALFFVAPEFNRSIRVEFGTYAKYLLYVILFVKPLMVLLRPIGLLRTIVGLRRQLGVSAFYLGFFHFLGYTSFVSDRLPHEVLWDTLQTVNALWYGGAALVLMSILAATSNNIATRLLKKWWKRVHRIAYLVLPLVLIHIGLLEDDGYGTAVLVGVGFTTLKVAEWWTVYSRRRKRSNRATTQ